MRKTLVRIVAVALLLYSLLSLWTVRRRVFEARALLPPLREELRLLCQEGSRLQALLEQGIDDEYIEVLARERLGLVKSGDIIFYFR